MRKHGTLLYGFLQKNFIILRRYPLNFVGTLLTFLLVFLLVFWGGRSIAPAAIGESLDAIIVGFFLFSVVQSTFFFLSGTINSEAKYGTLEQLYVSPFAFTTVMFAAVTANIVLSVTFAGVNLAVVLLVTGRTLSIDLLTIGPVLALGLVHAVGVSLLLGGVALLYKRIRSLFQIVQFVFLGLISVALTSSRLWPRLLPVGQAAAMLRETMVYGTRLWQFPAFDHAVLAGTAVVYLLVGYLSFYVAQHRARQRGLLDDY